MVGVVALALGVLTAYAQDWLPQEWGSLANSSGSWALVAFGLALLAADIRVAAASGSLTLLTLLGGYVLGSGIRGYPSGAAMIVFWAAAGLLAGPLLGLGAYWVKTESGPRAALGIGAMSGVLVGEGAYGLAYIADTTFPPYWWGEIVAGLVLLFVVALRRLHAWRIVALSVGVTILVACAFIVVYSQGLLALLA
ncbi:MAG: hypothetical protein H7Y19_04535 [Luteimonas sp.]|nr:hypothetical protein [Luteimonas sp.]